MTVTAVRPDGSQEQLAEDILQELQAHFRGAVVAQDGAQDAAEPCPLWNAMFTDRPALVTRCTGTADVADAVAFARDHGLLVGVRGGGHSVAGLSTVSDGMWTDPAQDRAAIAWTRAAWDQMSTYGTGAPYLNFTSIADEPLDAGVGSAFGRNLDRLRRIKTAYDPANFFRLNNNVLPLG